MLSIDKNNPVLNSEDQKVSVRRSSVSQVREAREQQRSQLERAKNAFHRVLSSYITDVGRPVLKCGVWLTNVLIGFDTVCWAHRGFQFREMFDRADLPKPWAGGVLIIPLALVKVPSLPGKLLAHCFPTYRRSIETLLVKPFDFLFCAARNLITGSLVTTAVLCTAVAAGLGAFFGLLPAAFKAYQAWNTEPAPPTAPQAKQPAPKIAPLAFDPWHVF
jgi:hypothetical protein